MEHEKKDIEEILEFCVNLSRNMIISGANLERVHLANEFICKSYGLKDVSIYLLSTHISLSAYDSEGDYASRQASIPAAGINLERLRSLNQLSFKVAEITPAPKVLAQMLSRAMQVREYSDWVVLLARILAMSCLCFMFGGGFNDLIAVASVTALIHFLMAAFEHSGLDRLVINALTMWFATSAAIFFVYTGVANNLAAVLITVSMIVIPGIPLVNAMRNLICGREINGILQMLKIFIETMALAMGIYVALIVLGGFALIQAPDSVLLEPYIIVLLSYIASVGFGTVFQIPVKDLWLAGLGGALTRISLLLLTPVVSNRLLFMTISALIAALYADFWAVKRKQPSTYFVYPSIIPLIPGDLFFYAISGLYAGNYNVVETNGINCLLSLSGLSIGFVLSSAVSHHIRRNVYRAKNFNLSLNKGEN